SNFISRIHLEDLARIVRAVFEAGIMADSTYLVGDENPCSIGEVANWLCQEMNLPLPESIALEEAHPTLRGNRAIDASRILNELQLKLLYPNYKEGYKQCIANGFRAEVGAD
ncbi:MAG: hypothetical protein K2X27_28255, partial [Candidatus Obscuribacterales bacterium]|nr:hypothetical protein [Candidatus Obscuribacterales bacterium]